MLTLDELRITNQIIVAGHRGYSGRFPENTLLAYRKAAEVGCDIIELDVTLSKDGIPVISHDDNLERVSDGTGMIEDYTCEELKQFDFGIRHGKLFQGLRIPTFWEALELLKTYPQVFVDVDFKIGSQIVLTVEKTLEIIRRLGMEDRCIYNSCDGRVISSLAEQGYLTVGAPETYIDKVNYSEETYQRLWGVCIPMEELTPESARMYLEKGIVVAVVSPDTSEQVQYALQCGATFLIADDPCCALKAAESLNDCGRKENRSKNAERGGRESFSI